MAEEVRIVFHGDAEQAVAEIERLRNRLQSLNREALASRVVSQGPFAGTGGFLNEAERTQAAITRLTSDVTLFPRPNLSDLTSQIRLLENHNRIKERSIQLEREAAQLRATQSSQIIQRLAPLGGIATGTEALKRGEGPAADLVREQQTREMRRALNQNLVNDSAQAYAQERAAMAQHIAAMAALEQEGAAAHASAVAAKAAVNKKLMDDAAMQQAAERRNMQIMRESLSSIEAAVAANDKYATALKRVQEAARQGQVESIRSLRTGQFGDQSAFLKSLEPPQGWATLTNRVLGHTRTVEQLGEASERAARSLGRLNAASSGGGGGGGHGPPAAASGDKFRNLRILESETTALFDEFERGQRGAMVSTFGATLRRLNVPQLMAAAVPIGAVVGIERLTSSMAKLAEHTQNIAAAAGMSTEAFSKFANIMAIFGGNADGAIRGLEVMSQHMRQAIVDPTSEASGAFSRLGISSQQLATGLRDPVSFIDLLRQRFQALPNDMARVDVMRSAIGRGFESLIPILNQNNEEFAKWSNEARATFTDEVANRLKRVAQESEALQISLKRLGVSVADLAVNYTGLSQHIRGAIDALSDYINKSDEASKKAVVGGVLGGAIAGGVVGTVIGGPVGGIVGAVGGGVAGGVAGPTLNDLTKRDKDMQFTAVLPPPIPPPVDMKTIENISRAKEELAQLNDVRLRTASLTSEFAEPKDLDRELQANVKILSQEEQLRDAGFKKEIAEAGTNVSKVIAIEEQRTAAVAAALAKEQSLRENYANRLKELGQPALAEEALDSDTMSRRKLEIETNSIQEIKRLHEQDLQNFVRTKENEIREAKGDFDKIAAIISEWQTKVAATYDKDTEDYKRHMEEIRRASISAQEQMFKATEENVNSQNRLSDLQLHIQTAMLQQQVASHSMSRAQMDQAELGLTQSIMAQQEARVQAELSNDSLTIAQKQKLYEQLAELYAKDAEKQAQIQEKITAALEAENKKRVQALTSMFDSIGSTLENAVVGALTGKPMKIQDFYKAIFTDVAKAGTSILSQLAGKSIASTLGVKVSEGDDTSIGSVLGRALGDTLGLTKSSTPNNQAAITAKLAQAQEAATTAANLLNKGAEKTDTASGKFDSAADKFTTAVTNFDAIISKMSGTGMLQTAPQGTGAGTVTTPQQLGQSIFQTQAPLLYGQTTESNVTNTSNLQTTNVGQRIMETQAPLLTGRALAPQSPSQSPAQTTTTAPESPPTSSPIVPPQPQQPLPQTIKDSLDQAQPRYQQVTGGNITDDLRAWAAGGLSGTPSDVRNRLQASMSDPMLKEQFAPAGQAYARAYPGHDLSRDLTPPVGLAAPFENVLKVPVTPASASTPAAQQRSDVVGPPDQVVGQTASLLSPDQFQKASFDAGSVLNAPFRPAQQQQGSQIGPPTDIRGNLGLENAPTGSGTGGFQGFKQVPENVPLAYNYLVNNVGLDPAHAAGAVNWMFNVESGLNPTASNSIGAFGIAQWLGARKDSMFSQFGQNPNFSQQLQFLGQELRGGDSGGPRFASSEATNERQAFSEFGRYFERPSARELNLAQSRYSAVDPSLLRLQTPTQVASGPNIQPIEPQPDKQAEVTSGIIGNGSSGQVKANTDGTWTDLVTGQKLDADFKPIEMQVAQAPPPAPGQGSNQTEPVGTSPDVTTYNQQFGPTTPQNTTTAGETSKIVAEASLNPPDTIIGDIGSGFSGREDIKTPIFDPTKSANSTYIPNKGFIDYQDNPQKLPEGETAADYTSRGDWKTVPVPSLNDKELSSMLLRGDVVVKPNFSPETHEEMKGPEFEKFVPSTDVGEPDTVLREQKPRPPTGPEFTADIPREFTADIPPRPAREPDDSNLTDNAALPQKIETALDQGADKIRSNVEQGFQQGTQSAFKDLGDSTKQDATATQDSVKSTGDVVQADADLTQALRENTSKQSGAGSSLGGSGGGAGGDTAGGGGTGGGSFGDFSPRPQQSQLLPSPSSPSGSSDSLGGLSKGLSTLSQGLGLASSAALLFGGHLSTTAKTILGAVGLIGQALPFIKNLGGIFNTTSSAVQAASTTTTALQTANLGNTVATTANTFATQTNSAAESAAAASSGAGSAIGGIFKAIPIIGALFEQGGIVPSASAGMMVPTYTPSAKGGMVVPNVTSGFSAARGMIVPPSALSGGGQISVLHPREMVLPSRLSEGVQNLIDKGNIQQPIMSGSTGDSNSFTNNHNYNINISAVDAHSVDRMIVSRPKAVAEAFAKASRGNSPFAGGR